MIDKLPENIPLKYPVVLVHGIACRDKTKKDEELSWGPIPEMLCSRGVQVYFGHSDSWASIENNAQQIKDTVNNIIDSTGCSKVNIIAHSKGGLEARYMITHLGMEDKVASLTTMDTPHRGVVIADIIYKYTPAKIIKKLGQLVDKRAKRLGDTEPNTYVVGTELSIAGCEEFNRVVPDSDKVFYQSVSCDKLPRFSPKYAFTSLWLRVHGYKHTDGIVPDISSEWGQCLKVHGLDHDNLRGQCIFTKQRQLMMLLYFNLMMILISKGM